MVNILRGYVIISTALRQVRPCAVAIAVAAFRLALPVIDHHETRAAVPHSPARLRYDTTVAWPRSAALSLGSRSMRWLRNVTVFIHGCQANFADLIICRVESDLD